MERESDVRVQRDRKQQTEGGERNVRSWAGVKNSSSCASVASSASQH